MMTVRQMRTWLAIISLFVVTACALQQAPPLGTGDQLATNSGDGSGIGGTGIVGTITGYGSIYINGQEIFLQRNTRIEEHGKIHAATHLAIGMRAEVLADEDNGRLIARLISLRSAVVGPVQAINIKSKHITVMGQNVVLATKSFNGVRIGDTLRISGQRLANGDIKASYIDKASTPDKVSVYGPISRLGQNDFWIAGLRIQSIDALKGSLQTGQWVQVSGHYESGRLAATTVQIMPTLPFEGHAKRLLLELDSPASAISEFRQLRPWRARLQTDSVIDLRVNDAGGWELHQQTTLKGLPQGKATAPANHITHDRNMMPTRHKRQQRFEQPSMPARPMSPSPGKWH